MGLFRRSRDDEPEGMRCPQCGERVPDGAGECMMCGADLRPLVREPERAVAFAIRCHPCTPAPSEELERWLKRHADELRASAPGATVRLSRLTQDGPNGGPYAGWLVEVGFAGGEPPLDPQRLADALRDMRLLGLEPTLLTPPAAANADAVAY